MKYPKIWNEINVIWIPPKFLMISILTKTFINLVFTRLKSQTHSGASTRFTKLSDGTFQRRKAGRNHNFAKKDSASRSNLRAPVVTTKEQTAFIRNLSV